MPGTGLTIRPTEKMNPYYEPKLKIMKTENVKFDVMELDHDDLINVSGGGEADDLAYNVAYLVTTTNPLFWAAKYSSWVLNKITGN